MKIEINIHNFKKPYFPSGCKINSQKPVCLERKESCICKVAVNLGRSTIPVLPFSVYDHRRPYAQSPPSPLRHGWPVGASVAIPECNASAKLVGGGSYDVCCCLHTVLAVRGLNSLHTCMVSRIELGVCQKDDVNNSGVGAKFLLQTIVI